MPEMCEILLPKFILKFCHLKETQRRRQQALSLSSEKDVELGKLIIEEPLEEDVLTDPKSSTDLSFRGSVLTVFLNSAIISCRLYCF